MNRKIDYKQRIADNLIYLMQIFGVTRKELSEATGIKYTTLTDWLNGRTYPRLDALEGVAGFFSLELPDLFIDISETTDVSKRVLEYARRFHMMQTKDYSDTYPAGFFDYFSEPHDIDFEDPEDQPAEEIDLNL